MVTVWSPGSYWFQVLPASIEILLVVWSWKLRVRTMTGAGA